MPNPIKNQQHLARAARYVAHMPAAISGQGGHRATFAVAVALVHGFALDEHDAWAVLCAYNARCAPPWSERALRHKLTSAAKLTTMRILKHALSDIEEQAWRGAAAACIYDLMGGRRTSGFSIRQRRNGEFIRQISRP